MFNVVFELACVMVEAEAEVEVEVEVEVREGGRAACVCGERSRERCSRVNNHTHISPHPQRSLTMPVRKCVRVCVCARVGV